MPERTRAHIFVSGRVQDVFFRDNTETKANQLGLSGWVRNTADGKVEAVFEGAKDRIEEIIEWAKQGPPKAEVENIKVEWQEPTGEFSDFKIRC